jgi:hypothetical protein
MNSPYTPDNSSVSWLRKWAKAVAEQNYDYEEKPDWYPHEEEEDDLKYDTIIEAPKKRKKTVREKAKQKESLRKLKARILRKKQVAKEKKAKVRAKKEEAIAESFAKPLAIKRVSITMKKEVK